MPDSRMSADFSPERRTTALHVLRDPAFVLSNLSYPARLMYAVGTLIADDAGAFPQEALDQAMADPSVVQVARALLREART